MIIKSITPGDLRQMHDQEALILQGCGGDLTEWVEGINGILTEEEILKDGFRFEEAYTFKNEGLTCLMFPLEDGSKINMGKLALWRIGTHHKASLTIWKFDWTNAFKDGVWDEDSFISTGWRESYVEEVLGETVREGDANGNPDHPLGNGQNSNGYALKGVEFTILRVADIVTFTESANDQHPDYNLTQVLYAFDKDKAADLLTSIGLGDGAGRYENADVLNYETSAPLAPVDAEAGVDAQAIAQVRNCWYYQSDVLNKALADALEANATTVKDALEAYVAASDEAIVMDKTNENGKTIKRDLDLGLWLCIETKVPEMVTSTTNPFFVSLPMTTVSGDANSASPEGGHFWNYDVVVYPKNNTGIPSLTKEVRESVKDTGTNGGTDDINDGFAHAATGSAGDVMEFQILAGIPTITSNATSIQTWNFYDTIDQGLTYNKALKDVKIEIFSDEECTDKVATWVQDDGKFTVEYSSDDRHMNINVTEAGLAEINSNQENVNGKHILFNHDEGGEKADFSGCRLTNLDMRHMQLNGADFTGALLEGVRMNDAGLCFCTFRDAKLVGCNLNGAVAEESDFCGATFTECKMRNGIYTHSNFAHTSFQDTDLWMSSFASCCIENSSIMDTETEGVNLSGTSEDEESWVNDSGIRIGGMGGM